ncbi:MAG: alpha-L-rhamnosidase [Ignavibacteriae bacterium]|nr:alpha-L-rhamnosidase [Ignavibacteriota bacterium]
MILKIFIVIILFTNVLFSFYSNENNKPFGLLCELLRYPETAVITDSLPEFSWIVPEKFEEQKYYRILVSSTKKILEKDSADCWDSQKTESNISTNIDYFGKALSENSSYFWKVKVWDKFDNESDYSEIQQFNISKFSRENLNWSYQSNFIKLNDSIWVSENRQTSTFHKVSLKKIIQKEKSWFIDFGKSAFATLELNINSISENDSIKIILGERKNEIFAINRNVGKSNIGLMESIIKLKKGNNKYNIEIPTHHSNSPNHQKLAPFYPEVIPFRFVEIISDKKIELLEINQLALYYPFDDSASNFKSSDENLNCVWDLCKYTLKVTPFLGIYADGNRERMPYEADAFIQQLGHYSVDREFSIAKYSAEFLLFNPSWPTEWHMHLIMMAWNHFMYTGDKEFLKNNYELLKNKTLITLAREDGLISTWTEKNNDDFLKRINFSGKKIEDIVDWPKGTPIGSNQANNAGPTPEGERDGFEFSEINTVVNSFHYNSLILISKIAEVLNFEEDKKFFCERAELVKKSIQVKLFDIENKLFNDGESTNHKSLHGNMFPLLFNLVPIENSKNIIEFIKSKGMACSVYGAQHLLEALFNFSEAEYAISLMNSNSKRSWMNMINVGSTMTTEAWDEYYKPNLTWNHAWGSAPANIIPRKIFGIEPIEPAFKKIRITPQPGSLKSMNYKLPTISGNIILDFKNENNSWLISLKTPSNTTMELLLPCEFMNVEINSKKIEPNKKVFFAGKEKNLFKLKNGYFTIKAN